MIVGSTFVCASDDKDEPNGVENQTQGWLTLQTVFTGKMPF